MQATVLSLITCPLPGPIARAQDDKMNSAQRPFFLILSCQQHRELERASCVTMAETASLAVSVVNMADRFNEIVNSVVGMIPQTGTDETAWRQMESKIRVTQRGLIVLCTLLEGSKNIYEGDLELYIETYYCSGTFQISTATFGLLTIQHEAELWGLPRNPRQRIFTHRRPSTEMFCHKIGSVLDALSGHIEISCQYLTK